MIGYVYQGPLDQDFIFQIHFRPTACRKFWKALLQRKVWACMLGHSFFNELISQTQNVIKQSEGIITDLLRSKHELNDLELTIMENTKMEKERHASFFNSIQNASILGGHIECPKSSYMLEMSQVDIRRDRMRENLLRDCRTFNSMIYELERLYRSSEMRYLTMITLGLPSMKGLPKPFNFTGV